MFVAEQENGVNRASPELLIAHVDLLHAVDKLLKQTEVVRKKRDALTRLIQESLQGKTPKKR